MNDGGRKICPECGDDFTDWPGGDDEGVWGRDGLNYCSGECVVRRFRRAGACMDDAGLMDGHAPTMTCGFCGKPCPRNRWSRCSWEYYDRDRDDPAEHETMIQDAPEAFEFFLGLGPGQRVDG